MNPLPRCRWAFAFLFFAHLHIDAQVLGDLKVAFIRVSFPVGNYPGFTGNGNYEMVRNNICGDYTIDTAPHDLKYFNSHVEAVDQYFRSVSHGKFGLDLTHLKILPSENEGSYVIQKPMNYYNELGKEDVHEKRITELLRDGIQAAFDKDKIDLSSFDLIAIIHPGVGQDFKLPFLDPTPEDIPSTYVDKKMVNTHLGGPIQIGNASIPAGIILPESQNHILMDQSIYRALTNPCNVQFSVTGTWAMMIGFAVGLPPLWDLETGLSGVGVFSLMDQGSNNGNGIVPAPPDAWTRIYAGWETATTIKYPGRISIQSGIVNGIVKVPISNNEYFLIENRNNWFRNGVSIDSARYAVWDKTDNHPSAIQILMDSVGVKKNEYGVITQVPNYDLGLPGSGLLIWHIDEQKINEGIKTFSINGDRKHRGIDLEEADGAQDIGYISNLLTDPSSGYWGDMWFAENKEFFRANAEGSMDFSAYTYPNSKSNSGANSGVNIIDISHGGESMSFDLSSSYDAAYLTDENKSILFQWDVDGDGDLDFVGEGDSLWWGDDLNDINAYYKNEGKNLQVCVVQNSNFTTLAMVKQVGNDQVVEWFKFDETIQNFQLMWTNRIRALSATKLLKADGQNNQVWIRAKGSQYIVTQNKIENLKLDQDNIPYIDNNYSIRYYLNTMGISLIENSNSENIIFKGEFNYFSLIDLDNDGNAELILTDKEGRIHVLDSKFIYKNGFPINANAIGPILGVDLIEDNKPELIYQSEGGNIYIMNSEGIELNQISTTYDLTGLGVYDGYNMIITNKNIFKFKKSYNTEGNDWNYTFGTPDFSRILMNEKSVTPKTYLIDSDLTYAYPNPSYGEIVNFRIQVGQAENIKINIFDLAGFPVENIKKDFQLHNFSSNKYILNGVEEVSWNVTNIKSGIYIARVIVSGNGQSEEKIIKVGVIK